jgi:acyl-CoA synthetase (AMP-forming)/AMP-acid ligase II
VQDVTLERFASAFAPCGFRREAWLPCYGLAEATLIVSGGAKKSPPIVRAFERGPLGANQALAAPEGADSALRLVGCGQALPGHQIVIVDPASRTRCPPGRVGEIWVAGPSVALGYWNQADETRQNFCACLADTGEGPFLRTGDLGFLHLGELFVTGRLKDLIVIDGRNVHPQDIELTVEQSHPAVQPGGSAAFSVDLAGQEQLVILAEVARGRAAPLREPPAPEDQVLVRSIRRAVAEHHDLQARTVLLLKPGGLPKTSSGKLQRQFCRSGFLAGTLGGLEAEE